MNINNRSTKLFFFFFFNDTATTEIYTLSLHDALPICISRRNSAKAVEIVEENQQYLLERWHGDRKSTRLNSSHDQISYAVFCLKKKKNISFAMHLSELNANHDSAHLAIATPMEIDDNT